MRGRRPERRTSSSSAWATAFQIWDRDAFHARTRRPARAGPRRPCAERARQQRAAACRAATHERARTSPSCSPRWSRPWRPRAGDVIIDATFGAGGYTRAILATGAEVIAFDRDPTVQPHADAVANDFPGQFQPGPHRLLGPGRRLRRDRRGAAGRRGLRHRRLVDAAGRGRARLLLHARRPAGHADGRRGPDAPPTSSTTWDHGRLARIFKLYGEERQSRRIATAILRRRVEQPFERTLDLAEVVEKALGGRRGAPIHPATRTFQALRIAVNDELGELRGRAGRRRARRWRRAAGWRWSPSIRWKTGS